MWHVRRHQPPKSPPLQTHGIGPSAGPPGAPQRLQQSAFLAALSLHFKQEGKTQNISKCYLALQGQAHPSHHMWAPLCLLTGCAHPMAMGSAALCAQGAVGSLCARGGRGVPIHADGEGVGPCSALAPGFPCRWRRGTARRGPGTPCRVTPTTCSRPGAGAAPPTAPGAPGAPPSCTPPPRLVSVLCAVSPVRPDAGCMGLVGQPYLHPHPAHGRVRDLGLCLP